MSSTPETPDIEPVKRTRRHKQGEKLRDADKVECIPVKYRRSGAA